MGEKKVFGWLTVLATVLLVTSIILFAFSDRCIENANMLMIPGCIYFCMVGFIISCNFWNAHDFSDKWFKKADGSFSLDRFREWVFIWFSGFAFGAAGAQTVMMIIYCRKKLDLWILVVQCAIAVPGAIWFGFLFVLMITYLSDMRSSAAISKRMKHKFESLRQRETEHMEYLNMPDVLSKYTAAYSSVKEKDLGVYHFDKFEVYLIRKFFCTNFAPDGQEHQCCLTCRLPFKPKAQVYACNCSKVGAYHLACMLKDSMMKFPCRSCNQHHKSLVILRSKQMIRQIDSE